MVSVSGGCAQHRGTGGPRRSAPAGRYFFSSAVVNDRSSNRRCVMSRASARSRSEPLASSTPRASSCRTKSSNRSEASASRKVKRLYPMSMSLTHVGLTQHPCRLNAARPRKVSTRFDRSGLERNSEGRRLRGIWAWLVSEKLRTLRRSPLNDPMQFTSLVVRQAPCSGEKLRLREPGPSVVFAR